VGTAEMLLAKAMMVEARMVVNCILTVLVSYDGLKLYQWSLKDAYLKWI
jgi:hypothetical protein